jgi:(S)-2-hydroxyglutarate dehydrogenase
VTDQDIARDRPHDVVVIGAGIVGLATAYKLLQARPGLDIAIVDKEERVAAHQTGHNSGVLHSGVYYRPGSLKARLCRQGKAELEDFAATHGVPVERCGKLIVATDSGEFERLAALKEGAEANGVSGTTMLGPEGLRDVEPHATGARALHVPETAVVDFGRIARALAAEVMERGGMLRLGQAIEGLGSRNGVMALRTGAGELRTRHVITCAGLQSDRVLRTGPPADERVLPFRGDYYTLRAEAGHLVRALIYPVPDPGLPFLGVHLTRRIDGAVWAGPNAVLALAREGYGRTDVDLRDVASTLGYPGFWRLARRHWRLGAGEVWRDVVASAYARQIRRYLPAISASDLTFGPSGVRAQAVRRDGRLVDDFSILATPDVIEVRNAPSPAATSSLAIGAHISNLALREFSL